VNKKLREVEEAFGLLLEEGGMLERDESTSAD
jgi:hypothetical protein